MFNFRFEFVLNWGHLAILWAYYVYCYYSLRNSSIYFCIECLLLNICTVQQLMVLFLNEQLLSTV